MVAANLRWVHDKREAVRSKLVSGSLTMNAPISHLKIRRFRFVEEQSMLINISPMRELSGLIGACLVDSDTGMILTSEFRGGIDLELAGAGMTEVVRAMRNNMEALKVHEKLEDILISLQTQYHLIRLLESNEALFIYVVLERKLANLALARIMMKKVDQSLDLR